IAGAYAVPLIVTTPHPSIAGLLGYAMIVAAGSTALMRWRGWVWLAWLALGGAVLWALAAMAGAGEAELLWPMGLYLLALPLLFLLVAVVAGWGCPALPGSETGRLHLLMVPPTSGTGSYLGFAAALGVVYGLGGFALLPRVANPARWAIVSAATPLLLLIAAYGRL